MLAELMRLQFSVAVGGTHGKTTTTSMVACLLDAGGLDPTVVNGGIINAYGTNAKVGDGRLDRGRGRRERRQLPAPEVDGGHRHQHRPRTPRPLRRLRRGAKAFRDFVENIPFYGFAAICTDHPEVQRLVASISNRRLVAYGVNPQAEVRAENMSMGPDGCRFDVVVQSDPWKSRRPASRACTCPWPATTMS
jgi:UDP-N-acetylmuramate--alanine ligase